MAQLKSTQVFGDLNVTGEVNASTKITVNGKEVWDTGNLLNIGTTAATARTALGLGTGATRWPSTAEVTGLTAELAAKANTSTQVIAGTGLTGGGTLAANRTLSVNYGTAAGTAAQGNDSRIVNAVPNSITITAGTGLSGGGTLAANLTLSVNYGTAAGTAAQGNDSRLSNSREWTGATISQAEAEAGTATTRRAFTAQRVRQAADSAIAAKSGSVNGIASLDGNGKIPLTQLSDSIIGQVEYMGLWAASTNTPTLPTTPAEKGHYYVVSALGTQFGHSFEVGDWVISNGASWDKVDNTDAVSSVNGRTGNVTGLAESNDTRFTNSREWTASEVSQAEAEAGTATTARKWTAQRVSQAITALGLKIGTTATTAKAGNWMPTYAEVTGKPTTFTPSAHTHTLSQITDAGSVASLNTNASTANFLRGDGTWVTPPNTNTTYAEITDAEIDAGTASTLRTITGRRMKYALDKKADTSHTHTWTQVTGQPATATRWPTFDEVSGKPSTFAPSSHSHAWSTITSRPNDNQFPTTAQSIGASQNLDSYTTPGFYYQDANASATNGTNYPVAMAGTLVVTKDAGTTQMYYEYNGGGVHYRTFYGSTWTAWQNILKPAWSNVSGQPSTATRWPTWAEVTGKPTTFADSTKLPLAGGVISGTTASTSATTGALQCRGGLGVSGNIYAGGNVTAYSDIRLKKDIECIPDALAKVIQLNGVTYTRKDSGERHTGLIAQEVQKVLPEAVSGDEYLGVAYGNMVGLLIESIKELKTQADELKAEVDELKEKLKDT